MIKLGVIADDFTGASDAASFLVKAKNKTILITDLNATIGECDCLVVALKIRSVSPQEAISKVKQVIDLFEQLHVQKIYYKYCSTFDSTPKGNIGVVLDYLLEYYNCKYTLLCPSLPINGRTVNKGILYVNGIELAKSPLKDHPLNPMWDSYIPTLMKEQSKYPCKIITRKTLEDGSFIDMIDRFNQGNEHYYIVPDYYEPYDGELIAKRFNDLKVISGGSGLLEYLLIGDYVNNTHQFNEKQKAMIVCGSCSKMTNQQVQSFKKTSNYYQAIHLDDIVNHQLDAHSVFNQVLLNLPKVSLIYSDGCEKKVTGTENAQLMEEFLADIAYQGLKEGFNKIIVAGGETSGAVTLKLGYQAFYVGKSVAPGVPVLIPVENQNIKIILKSGNFGDEHFFEKALEVE